VDPSDLVLSWPPASADPLETKVQPLAWWHLSRIEAVGAPAPSCGGGQGWGVARGMNRVDS